MKLSGILLKSSILIGLGLIASQVFSRPVLTRSVLLKKIDAHLLATIKTARLALEKSNSSLLHEIVQRVSENLIQGNPQLKKYKEGEDPGYPRDILIEANNYILNYDYDENSPFDLSYISHQLAECHEIIALLQDAINLDDDAIYYSAMKYQSIFLQYQDDLNNFRDNFTAVNEYRIRDFAHLIWEAEGRPEGQAVRHWMMAVELLNKISFADLQLALEDKRSLFEMFSTLPDIQVSLVNKNIH